MGYYSIGAVLYYVYILYVVTCNTYCVCTSCDQFDLHSLPHSVVFVVHCCPLSPPLARGTRKMEPILRSSLERISPWYGHLRTCVHFLSKLDVFHIIDIIVVVFIVVMDDFHNHQTAGADLPTGITSTALPNDSSSPYCADTFPRAR